MSIIITARHDIFKLLSSHEMNPDKHFSFSPVIPQTVRDCLQLLCLFCNRGPPERTVWRRVIPPLFRSPSLSIIQITSYRDNHPLPIDDDPGFRRGRYLISHFFLCLVFPSHMSHYMPLSVPGKQGMGIVDVTCYDEMKKHRDQNGWRSMICCPGECMLQSWEWFF